MVAVWESVTIERSIAVDDEPLGTKEKFWLVSDRDLWLFKFARSRGGVTRGEDWAEWVAFHLATLMMVPCATVRPATVEGRRGIMSRNVVERELSQRLVHGNSLLEESDRFYTSAPRRPNERYTVERVKTALERVGPPNGFTGPGHFTGFDVWAGYLLFDAWVAGRDRHHENWAVISDRGHRTLSPSYDHGNSFGFQENDEKRAACLADRDQFDRWLLRGRSHHFAGRPTLVDVANEALSKASRDAGVFWRDRLAAVDADSIAGIIGAVPVDLMSAVCGSFTNELLMSNRRRLLDADSAG